MPVTQPNVFASCLASITFSNSTSSQSIHPLSKQLYAASLSFSTSSHLAVCYNWPKHWANRLFVRWWLRFICILLLEEQKNCIICSWQRVQCATAQKERWRKGHFTLLAQPWRKNKHFKLSANTTSGNKSNNTDSLSPLLLPFAACHILALCYLRWQCCSGAAAAALVTAPSPNFSFCCIIARFLPKNATCNAIWYCCLPSYCSALCISRCQSLYFTFVVVVFCLFCIRNARFSIGCQSNFGGAGGKAMRK